MTRKKTIVTFSCKNNLQFFGATDCFTLTGHSNRHQRVFPPAIYNSWTRYVQLAFFLPTNKYPTSDEDVFRHTLSEAAKFGVNIYLLTL